MLRRFRKTKKIIVLFILAECMSVVSGCTSKQLEIANDIYTSFTGTGTIEDGPYVFDIENRRIHVKGCKELLKVKQKNKQEVKNIDEVDYEYMCGFCFPIE